MRIRTTVLAACAAVLLVPAAAQAATLSMEGGTLVYRADPGQGSNLLLASNEGSDGTEYLTFHDSAIDDSQISIQTNVCHMDEWIGAVCERNPNRPIRIEGSNDRARLSIFDSESVPDSIPVTINGNGGDDLIKDAFDGHAGRTFNGGAGDDELDGYSGNDTLDGGDGNDTVDGGEDNDVVRGGAGDDQVYGDHYEDPGSDVIDGGPGNDIVEDWDQPEKLDRQPQI